VRLVASIFICVFSFTLMFNVSAQGLSERSYQELKKGFAIGLRNESNARSKISLFQLTPRKTTLLVNHYMTLANDDDLVSRLFEEVVATGLMDRVVEDPTITNREKKNIESLGFELFESFALKGIKRLEYSDVRVYLLFVQTMLEVAPPKLCKAILLGDITGQRSETALAGFLFSKLSEAEVDSYLRIIRKAVFAEVKNFPGVRRVSEPQKKIAQDAFDRILFEELMKHPRAESLLIAATNLGGASDRDACELGLLSIGSILKMRGTVAEWQARVFLEDL
jgi:hypothetical protein